MAIDIEKYAQFATIRRICVGTDKHFGDAPHPNTEKTGGSMSTERTGKSYRAVSAILECACRRALHRRHEGGHKTPSDGDFGAIFHDCMPEGFAVEEYGDGALFLRKQNGVSGRLETDASTAVDVTDLPEVTPIKRSLFENAFKNALEKVCPNCRCRAERFVSAALATKRVAA